MGSILVELGQLTSFLFMTLHLYGARKKLNAFRLAGAMKIWSEQIVLLYKLTKGAIFWLNKDKIVP